mgnify:CR=1 FL=1
MPGMTPAERLVGRRMPPAPRHMDTLMASFAMPDGTFCGRLAPTESWLRPSHLKARRLGWPGVPESGSVPMLHSRYRPQAYQTGPPRVPTQVQAALDDVFAFLDGVAADRRRNLADVIGPEGDDDLVGADGEQFGVVDHVRARRPIRPESRHGPRWSGARCADRRDAVGSGRVH